MAAGKLASLAEFGGDRAQTPGQRLQIPIPAKLLEGGPVGGARFDLRICHQFECLERGPVLSPMLIRIGEPLACGAPRAIHLVQLSPALGHTASDGSDGKLIFFE